MERLAYCLDAGEQKWRTNEHVFINVCSLCTRKHFGSIANFVRFFGGNGHVGGRPAHGATKRHGSGQGRGGEKKKAKSAEAAGTLAPDGLSRAVFIMDGFMRAGTALADLVLKEPHSRFDLVYPMLLCYRRRSPPLCA